MIREILQKVQDHEISVAKAMELLRHTPKPKDEGGFAEGYKPCKCGAANAYLNIHKVVCCGNCGGPLEILPAPTDRQEALAAKLAFYKDWDYKVVSNGGFYWEICLRPKSTEQGNTVRFFSSTYEAAEAKAREWLEKLEDKK